jgi:VIT1/CCC1 family predicted Fe2+/Mn2+ transporter
LQQSAQNAKQEATAMIGAVRQEYAKKERILTSQLRVAKQRETESSDLISNYQSKIKEEAARQTATFKSRLQKEYDKRASSAEASYQSKTTAIYSLTLGALLYGFLATLLTACLSERFAKDFLTFLSAIGSAVSEIFTLAVEASAYTWTINEKIPYQFLNVIIAGLLATIVFILITSILYGLIAYGLFIVGKFYREEFFDLPSLIVALVSMAMLVWFADDLSFITWNLILIWFLIHGIYLLIRMMTTTSNSCYH